VIFLSLLHFTLSLSLCLSYSIYPILYYPFFWPGSFLSQAVHTLVFTKFAREIYTMAKHFLLLLFAVYVAAIDEGE